MRFTARVIPSGNATAVEIPPDVLQSLGAQGRSPIAVTINGHGWRSRTARMRGASLIGISAAQRAAAGIGEGDLIDIDIEVDEAPREVAEPADLADAVNAVPDVRASFDRLSFGLKRKRVAMIEDAKSPEVRQRKINKLIADLCESR